MEIVRLKLLVYLIVLIASLRLSSSLVVNNLPKYCTRTGTWISCENLNFGVFDDVQFDRSNKIKGTQFLFQKSNFSTLPRNMVRVLDSIQWLYVKNCGVKTINKWNFEDGNYLKRLSIVDNDIPKLSNEIFVYLMNLEYLDLENNNLRELEPKVFSGMYKLKSLFLEKNRIRKLPADLFASLSLLSTINLNDNEIDYIDGSMFKTNMQLATLFLRNNRLRIIDKNIVNNRPVLEYIMAHNLNYDWKITGTNFLSNLKFVRKFDISGNYFPHISLDTLSEMTSLVELNVSQSGLNWIQYGALSHQTLIEILDLSMNKLIAFEVDLLLSIKGLRGLYLQENQLSSIAYTTLSSNNINLNMVAITGNPWQCSYLQMMLDYFKSKNITTQLPSNPAISTACEDTFESSSTQSPEDTMLDDIDSQPPTDSSDNIDIVKAFKSDIELRFDKVESFLGNAFEELILRLASDEGLFAKMSQNVSSNFEEVRASLRNLSLNHNVDDILNVLKNQSQPQAGKLDGSEEAMQQLYVKEANSILDRITEVKDAVYSHSSKVYVIVILCFLGLVVGVYLVTFFSKRQSQLLRNQMARRRLSDQTEIVEDSYLS